MIDSEALVARVDGHHVWLEFVAGGGDCGQCSSAQGCGLGTRAERRLQRVRNTIGARLGDTVLVSVPDGAVLKAAAISYLMPLALALIGAAAGTALAADPGAIAGAGAGLIAGWLLLRGFGERGEPVLALRIKRVVVNLQRDQEP